MNLIAEHRPHYDTLVLGYLKDKFNLVPQDTTCLTDCEPVRQAHAYAVGQLQQASLCDLHLNAVARAIAAGPK